MKRPLYELDRVDTTWHPIDRATHRVICDDHYDTLITRPSAVYCDGALAAVYLPEGDFPADQLSAIFDSLERVPFGHDPQGRTASGGQAGGLATASRIFGWMPRRAIRHDFCHVATMARTHPMLHEQLCALGQHASDLYEYYVPDIWRAHSDYVSNTLYPQHLVSGVYTGGIVNKDSTLGGHVDGGNVRNTWNSQLTIKKGVEGGFLALPELRVALEVADGSFALFGAQSVWHGVTPVLHTQVGAVRYSMVWYALAMLKNCLPPEGELQRIQRKKTEREWKRAGLA